jgi:hypothetical protein
MIKIWPIHNKDFKELSVAYVDSDHTCLFSSDETSVE